MPWGASLVFYAGDSLNVLTSWSSCVFFAVVNLIVPVAADAHHARRARACARAGGSGAHDFAFQVALYVVEVRAAGGEDGGSDKTEFVEVCVVCCVAACRAASHAYMACSGKHIYRSGNR